MPTERAVCRKCGSTKLQFLVLEPTKIDALFWYHCCECKHDTPQREHIQDAERDVNWAICGPGRRKVSVT